MARQDSIIRFRGTMDNITFVKTKEGYEARKKTSMDAQRMATDPAFQRTRENMAEFARAGKAAKLLKKEFSSLLNNIRDGRLIARLNRRMMEVVKADATSSRGQRNILDGETELLNGFEFNSSCALNSVLRPKFTAHIDRASGALSIQIPSFSPLSDLPCPTGTSHYRLVCAGLEVDFDNEIVDKQVLDSGALVYDNAPTASLNLSVQLSPNSTHPLILALGIEFLQESNGSMYPLKSGNFNALAIVKVSGS